MALFADNVAVYSGLVFEKVNSILLGALGPEGAFKVKPKKELAADKLKTVLEVLLDRIYRDPLTKLPSYESFHESLEKIISKREEKKAYNLMHLVQKEIPPETILFLDMNYMKSFNNEIGMEQTDKVIAAVAEVIHDFIRNNAKDSNVQSERRQSTAKSNDIVARAKRAGDEFIVLLRGCSREDAKKKADELYALIKEKVFVVPVSKSISGKKTIIKNVSLSYGYYALDHMLGENEDHDTAISAISKAEDLMAMRKLRWKNDDKISEQKKITEPNFHKVQANEVEKCLKDVEPKNVITISARQRQTFL